MSELVSMAAFSEIEIDRTLERPVFAQLVEQLRDLILQQRLEQGLRLPSSRDLSVELALARKTVVSAYDQLIAEGYLTARQGAGTFVSDVSIWEDPPISERESSPLGTPAPAHFGEGQPLSPSTPEMGRFPRAAWSRAAAKAQRSISLPAMFEAPCGGYNKLRNVLTEHLWSMRGISCDPGQIIITAGMRESFSLVCSALLPKGQYVAVETPGYGAFAETLEQHGLKPIYIPVDEDGMMVEEALGGDKSPVAVCVSASRQYPTGAALSLARRAKLINWVARTKGWLIEDDYDCEFRFEGAPLQSMFAMDHLHRTIYFGSLSKTLFPQLRLSFMIAPTDIAARLIEKQNRRGSFASLPAQAALAEFILSGQYATHIRQMRRLYADRYKNVFAMVQDRLGTWVDPNPCSGGFHFAAYFKPEVSELIDDEAFAAEAQKNNVGVTSLSSQGAAGGINTSGLLIGFAGTQLDQSKLAVEKLRQMLEQHLSRN